MPPTPASVHLAPPSLASAVDILSTAEQASPCVFILPAAHAAACRALISRARAASLDNIVLFHTSHLSPLARTTLADMARAAAVQVTPGQLLAVLADLESSIRCLALSRSVTKLRRPAPSMLQHIASWLPSSRFLIQQGAGVTRLRAGAAPGPREIDLPRGSSVIVRGHGTGEEADAFIAALSDRLLQPPVITVDADPGDWWGRPAIVDVCLAPADLSPFLERAVTGSVECRWCRIACTPNGCQMCQPHSHAGADA